jgi:Ring finger domain
MGQMIMGVYKAKILLSSLYMLYIFPSTFSFSCYLWYVYIFRFFWRLPWLLPKNEKIETCFKPLALLVSMITMFFTFALLNECDSIPTELKKLAIFDLVYAGMFTSTFLAICVTTIINRSYFRSHTHRGLGDFARVRSDRSDRPEFTEMRMAQELEIISATLDALGILTFVESIDMSDWAQTDTRCSICLCDFEENDSLCKLRCNHVDHRECATNWFKQGLAIANCPRCRTSLIES